MELYYGYGYSFYTYHHGWENIWSALGKRAIPEMDEADMEYCKDLKRVACHLGYTPEDIDELMIEGYTLDEIEEFIFAT